MRVEASDEVFVRACRRDVHPYLVDVAGYGSWWPGVRSRPTRGPVGGAELELAPPRRMAPRQHVRVRLAKNRPDLGLLLDVRGLFAGAAEWYYLDEVDGTVVHHVLRAQSGDRGASRRLRDHRAAVRAGLHALKDLLESGRHPGEEPDHSLLADQAAAMEEFRAGVEAHRRKVGGRQP